MRRLTRSCGTMEPDLAMCRTSGIGTVIPGTDSEMYYCRLNNDDCRYAMSFGFDYLCKHPDNRLFLIPEDADPESFPLCSPEDTKKMIHG